MADDGFVTLDPGRVALGRPATPVGVFRLGSAGIEPMPWCRVLTVEAEAEGGEPGQAQFRYRFSDGGSDPDSLTGFEDVYGLAATGPAVIQTDDRLVVAEFDPDGNPIIVFDGFAQVPGLGLGPDSQEVSILAVGAEVRAYDLPLGGSIWRDADDLTALVDTVTDLDLGFNPTRDGVLVATMVKDPALWSGSGETRYPVFTDPTVPANQDERDFWTLPAAVRYLLAVGNPDQKYVQNPDFATLDDLLQAMTPTGAASAGVLDPSDPSTFTLAPILVPPDLDLEGRRWPEAIRILLDPHGFGMVFRTEQDENGLPLHRLELYRKIDATDETIQDLYLQPQGQDLDPGQTNLGAASLARDSSGLANQFRVSTPPIQYEVSVTLWPGFRIDAADAGTTAPFTEGDPGFTGDNLNKYRRFILDEAGEGHWDFKSNSWETQTATDIDALLSPPDAKIPTRASRRRRKPDRVLLTLDPFRQPESAQLWISVDYNGSAGAWDRTGTWQLCTGGWELLDDCCGVYLNIKNPDDWNIGKPTATGAGSAPVPFPSGKVRVVKSLASPDKPNPGIAFRLTCCLRSDQDLDILAARRATSPTRYTVEQRDEARDRFHREIITTSSHLNTTGAAITARDDTPQAQHYADSRRLAHELGPTAGQVTIPRLTRAYRVGDRIREIVGRGVGLETNVGADQGEQPVLPSVVKVTRHYDGRQATVLQLSDRRGEPRRVR